MSINKTFFLFWLSAFAIALVSLTLSPHVMPSSTTSANIASYTQTSPKLDVLKRVVDRSGVDTFSAFVERIARKVTRRHHRRRKRKTTCDDSKWNSRLIPYYNVSLVLTVDSNGCANFSSVQKAVDAAPYSSVSRTLIVIFPGTYRSLSYVAREYSILRSSRITIQNDVAFCNLFVSNQYSNHGDS